MWSLLTSRLAGPIGAGLSLLLGLGLALTLLTKNIEIRHLNKVIENNEKSLRALRQDNATLKGNQRTLEGSLKKCNDSIDGLKATSDAVAAAGLRALQEVQKAGRSVDQKIKSIDAMPKDTCEDALRILKSQ